MFLKILALVTVGLVAVIIAMVLFDLIIMAALAALASAFNMPWMGELDGFWVLLLVVLLMPKAWIWNRLGWNKPYVCHATDVINAPVGDVWDMYRLRPRTDYHSAAMPTVLAVPDTTDEFDLLVDSRLNQDDDVLTMVKMKVDEMIENFYIRMHCINKDTLPLVGKDLVDTEIWMTKFLNNIGPSGEATGEANQTMIMVMVAATFAVTALTFGAVWLALSLAG